jgi:hypothetical protein
MTFDGTTLTVTGNIVETSTRRIKENIKPLIDVLDKVLKLQGVSYNQIGNPIVEVGLIAEEVFEIIPELVTKNHLGQIQGVNYSRISAVLVEAIKELFDKVDEQDEFIKNIIERIEKLENK